MQTTWTTQLGLLLALLVALAAALPVTKTKKDEKKEESSTPATPDMETALEYERYLKEVVEALEGDPEFRKKLDKADEADIRSGKIAQELDYVNHHVRTKLDEIKRREMDRLRGYANREFELSNDIDREHLKIGSHVPDQRHIDHGNEHTFEIEDLRKLILKTSHDLAEADRKRRTDFKEYEMQKEFERESQMKEMDAANRSKFEQEVKEQQEKHKKHEKVHHPGNKAQLEDVWEKQDHMDRQDFDPHTFFMIHDVDGNGFWDETEVKALFIKELDKVYQSGLPEDDMRERAEEMERMREHVFQETDSNHDGLISFQEFLEQTKRDEFNKDPDWETVDEQPQYTHEEYLEFERRRQEEVQRMVAQGLLPPHPNMPQGYYPNAPHDAYQQQQHPSGAYQQPPPQAQLHYQNPQQQHQQQQQQYQQQQQQYQQHHQQQQQPQYQGQQVNLHPNQVYEHVPAQQVPQQQQQQQVPQQKQQQYQQIPQQQQQQYQQVPRQPQQQVPQQQVPQQQQQVPQQQQQNPQQQQPAPAQQQQQQVPQQQQQQVPQQQQQVPQQQQPIPQQQQQQVPQQQKPAAVPAAATINNQQPPAAQQQQIPIQQQQQQQQQKPLPQQQPQQQNIPPNH